MQHACSSRVLLAILLATGWSINEVRAFDIHKVGFYSLKSVKKFEGLDQQAAFVTFKLPWERRLGGRLDFSTSFTVAGGAVSQDSLSTTFVSVGPAVRLSIPFRYSGWFMELGTSPTYLGESNFVTGELGGKVHFTSFVVAGGAIGKKNQLSLAARLQHISNAGLRNPNPGVDLLGVQLSYSF